MARKKAKNKSRNTHAKRRSKQSISVKRKKRSYQSPGVLDKLDSFLDRTITVRSILKYSGIVLLFFLVVGTAFMLGRWSYGDTSSGPVSDEKISGAGTQVLKSSDNKDVIETKDIEKTELSSGNKTKEEFRVAKDDEVKGPTQEYYFEAEPLNTEPAEAVDAKVAEFGFTYSKVEVDVTDLERRDRGANWASIESIKLTVKNNEDHTIINPTRIKVKMNPKGKGSVWWDDEVFLPKEFKNLKPGQQITDTIPVHVTFSDIYGEKDFRVVVLDDYDVPITYYKKILVIQ